MVRLFHFVVAAVASVLVALSSSADAAADWTNFGLIQELNQQPGAGTAGAGLVFVTLAVPGNPSGCSVPTGFYFAVNDERKKRLFATLLAAQMTSRNVKLWVTGTCHTWGYAELDGVVVQ